MAGNRTSNARTHCCRNIWEKPCWLARRQKEVEIIIDSGNPNNPKLY